MTLRNGEISYRRAGCHLPEKKRPIIVIEPPIIFQSVSLMDIHAAPKKLSIREEYVTICVYYIHRYAPHSITRQTHTGDIKQASEARYIDGQKPDSSAEREREKSSKSTKRSSH